MTTDTSIEHALPVLAKDSEEKPPMSAQESWNSKNSTLAAVTPGLMKSETEKEDIRALEENDALDHKSDLIDLSNFDAVLASKLKLCNDSLDNIGWTPYHTKLFIIVGFGYATDSMLIVTPSMLYPYVLKEWPLGLGNFPRWITIGIYIGLFFGAIGFGLGTDIKGRKHIFNISLFCCAIFTLVAGAAPNYPAYIILTGLACFGAGGNLVLDTTIFCEWCPSRYQWSITLLALFWGIGQLTCSLITWAFVSQFCCPLESDGPCSRRDSMGWRYTCFTLGALVTTMSIIRFFALRLHETPKWCITQGRDDDAIHSLNYIANKYGRSNFLTKGHLRYLGQIEDLEEQQKRSAIKSAYVHLKGLFLNKKIGRSTICLWLLWMLVGIGFPVYNIFLPIFLQTRVLHGKSPTQRRIFVNLAISNASSVLGPIFAALLCTRDRIGRRGALAFGAVTTAIFMFAWTRTENELENSGFSAAIAVCLNLFYATLYGYTAEVMPAAYRATGTGVAVSLNRICGIVATLIAVYANAATATPLFICAGLFLLQAIISLLLPFEPHRKRPV